MNDKINSVVKYIAQNKPFQQADLTVENLKIAKKIKDFEEGKTILTIDDWKDIVLKSRGTSVMEMVTTSPKLPPEIVHFLMEEYPANPFPCSETVMSNLILNNLISKEELKELQEHSPSHIERICSYINKQNYQDFPQKMINFLAELYFDQVASYGYPQRILCFVNDTELIDKTIANAIEKEQNEGIRVSYSFLPSEILRTMAAGSYVLSDELKNQYAREGIIFEKMNNPTKEMINEAYMSITESPNKSLQNKFFKNALMRNFLPTSHQIDLMSRYVAEKNRKTDIFLGCFISRVCDPSVLEIANKLVSADKEVVYSNPNCPKHLHEERINKMVKKIELKAKVEKTKEIPPKWWKDLEQSLYFVGTTDNNYNAILNSGRETDIIYSIIISKHTPLHIIEKCKELADKGYFLPHSSSDNGIAESEKVYIKNKNEKLSFLCEYKIMATEKGLKSVNTIARCLYSPHYDRNQFTKIETNDDINLHFEIIDKLFEKYKGNDNIYASISNFKNCIQLTRLYNLPIIETELSTLTLDDYDIVKSHYFDNLFSNTLNFRKTSYKILDAVDEIVLMERLDNEKGLIKHTVNKDNVEK